MEDSRRQIDWRLILLARFLIVLTIIFILLVRMQTTRKTRNVVVIDFKIVSRLLREIIVSFSFFLEKKKKLITPVAVRGWHSSNLDCLGNFSKHNRNIPYRTERDSTMKIKSFSSWKFQIANNLVDLLRIQMDIFIKKKKERNKCTYVFPVSLKIKIKKIACATKKFNRTVHPVLRRKIFFEKTRGNVSALQHRPYLFLATTCRHDVTVAWAVRIS